MAESPSKRKRASQKGGTGTPKVEGPWSRSNILWPVLISLITLLAHCPSLASSFVWDDIEFVDNWLPRFDSLQAIFFPPDDIRGWPTSYYRPVGVLSLKVDAMVYGQSARGWHITNLIIHGIVNLQVYWLAQRLFRMEKKAEVAARITSLVFAVHPIHVESVNWIAGRSDPLATLFVLGAIFACLNWVDHGGEHRTRG